MPFFCTDLVLWTFVLFALGSQHSEQIQPADAVGRGECGTRRNLRLLLPADRLQEPLQCGLLLHQLPGPEAHSTFRACLPRAEMEELQLREGLRGDFCAHSGQAGHDLALPELFSAGER